MSEVQFFALRWIKTFKEEPNLWVKISDPYAVALQNAKDLINGSETNSNKMIIRRYMTKGLTFTS